MNLTFKGTWTDAQRSTALAQVKATQKILEEFGGLDSLLNRSVTLFPKHTYCRHEGKRYPLCGSYDPDTGDIIVRTRYLDHLSTILLHELGHAFFFETLSEAEQDAFTAWHDKHTTHLPIKQISRYILLYNARTTTDLLSVLDRHNTSLGIRLEYVLRQTMDVPGSPDDKKTPTRALPFETLDIPTFKHPVSYQCLPCNAVSYPIAWEVFAEAFKSYLVLPSSVPLPLRRQLTRNLRPCKTPSLSSPVSHRTSHNADWKSLTAA